MKKLLTALFALALCAFGGPANAAPVDSTTIWVGLGSGHLYNGTYDACTGAIVASGFTIGEASSFGEARYDESVTGTYSKATGTLSITSVYTVDPKTGYVNDSTGVNNSAYSYTLTGTVTDNKINGSYTITKTPVGGTSVTSAPVAFDGAYTTWFEVTDNGGTCTPPPVLDGGNHGQCVSTKAKTLSGKDLAVWARDVNKVGYDCHTAA